MVEMNDNFDLNHINMETNLTSYKYLDLVYEFGGIKLDINENKFYSKTYKGNQKQIIHHSMLIKCLEHT